MTLNPLPLRRCPPRLLLSMASLLLLTGCATAGAGDGGAPRLVPTVLGQDEGGARGQVRTAEGTVTLTGTGREAHFGTDEGTFAGIQTDALNFTFTARVASASFSSGNAKYGLAVREGLATHHRSFHIRYDAWEGNRCLQWFLRHHRAHDAHVGSLRAWLAGATPEFGDPEGFWLRVVRRYPYIRAYASRDGEIWTDVTRHHTALLAQEVWVGLIATAGGDGRGPMEVAYDQISFQVDPAPEDGDRPEMFEDFKPNVTSHMHVVKMESARGDEINPFVVIPDGMDPSAIRAIYYTPGNKEAVLYPNLAMPFENGPGRLRRPEGMPDWEGVWTFESEPMYRGFEPHGVVRLGGIFGLDELEEVLVRLAEATGIPHLANLPILPIGQSATGGAASRTAATYPSRTVAVVPTLIGPAGVRDEDPEVMAIPRMIIIGSRDGPHLSESIRAAPVFRGRNALVGIAPMWTVHHRVHTAQSLAWPFFVDMLAARLPADATFDAPPELTPLAEADGWLGLIDTWESNFPQAVPFRDYDGDPGRTVWLPNEHIARVWQAFCSNHPRTVIQFPRFDGHGGFAQAGPARLDWRVSTLAAGEPIELMASGPDAADVQVEYYAGLRRLEVLRTHEGNPFRVTLEGLPEGMHALYAITTWDGNREISRPVTVMVNRRE